MAFTFNELAVVWTFHQSFPSKYTPAVAELEAWDAQLVATYDDKLTEVLPEFEIALTRENKSRVLMMAVVSAGSAGTKTQVRNACKYYKFVMGQDLAASSGQPT